MGRIMLKLNNIIKKFDTKNIINNLDVTFEKGVVSVLLGPSGVGKSTLLRILTGLEQADSGTFFFNDVALNLENVNHQHKIGMVFQHFNLFSNFNVINNISFPLQHILHLSKQDADTTAERLLAKYGLSDKAHLSLKKLSGGQKQRLAIARTIALKPEVICMDEPTSALDPLLTSHVANTIQNLAKEGYTVVLSTHDTFLLQNLTCMLYLMHNGQIIESATSKNYWENSDAYPKLHAFMQGTK